MSIIVTETRPYRYLDLDDPRCLACGTAIPREQPLACPDPDCGAGYLNDGAPILEFWPQHLAEDPETARLVPALVENNNGVTWDWCESHGVYEQDHPMARRSCSYYAAEARLLRVRRDIYLSDPPAPSDQIYWEMLGRMRRNPFCNAS